MFEQNRGYRTHRYAIHAHTQSLMYMQMDSNVNTHSAIRVHMPSVPSRHTQGSLSHHYFLKDERVKSLLQNHSQIFQCHSVHLHSLTFSPGAPPTTRLFLCHMATQAPSQDSHSVTRLSRLLHKAFITRLSRPRHRTPTLSQAFPNFVTNLLFHYRALHMSLGSSVLELPPLLAIKCLFCHPAPSVSGLPISTIGFPFPELAPLSPGFPSSREQFLAICVTRHRYR